MLPQPLTIHSIIPADTTRANRIAAPVFICTNSSTPLHPLPCAPYNASSRLTHVEAHQPGDHHGEIELPCDGFRNRNIANHGIAWDDISIAHGGQRDKAE